MSLKVYRGRTLARSQALQLLFQDVHHRVPAGTAGRQLRRILVRGAMAHQRHEGIAP